MELIFIFIIPLGILLINCNYQNTIEYDNNGNYQSTEKHIEFTPPFDYDNGYVNKIDNFNLLESFNNGYYWTSNNVLFDGYNQTTIKNTSEIFVYSNTTYYFYYYGPINPLYIYVWVVDSNDNILDNQIVYPNTTYTPLANGYLKFFLEFGSDLINPNDVKLCFNISVSWANGNYVPFGQPLILYTNTDISGQNHINYTIWGQLKNLIVENLQLQDNFIIDIIISYTILWFTMFVIWHFFYWVFDGIVHLFIDWVDKGKKSD